MTRAEPMSGPGAGAGSGLMFDRIAHRYDLLNRLMSFGLDRWWRRQTVAALALGPGHRVLDLATGTADLALAVARRHDGVAVVGVDPSPRMLAIGRQKVERAGLGDRVTLGSGTAEALAFPDAAFDGVCMAFGIRNVPERDRALREITRVTRPGGRVAILELTEPRAGLLGGLARFYIHRVVPWLGALLSGAREYRYLEASIAAFPSPTAFTEMLTAAGLEPLRVVPLTFGACTLFVATPRLPRRLVEPSS
jgi:demethylmenaquinone methyltransferase/2-methoxy-6-polyprenyl-1,4-benzoquinol methylase